MIYSTLVTVLGASLAIAAPLYPRTTLDAAATAEAQPRDNTATRAVTAQPIKVCVTATIPPVITGLIRLSHRRRMDNA